MTAPNRIVTNHDGRHAIHFRGAGLPSTVPDGLILELAARFSSPESVASAEAIQVALGDITSRDLQLGPECNDKTCDPDWIRDVMVWAARGQGLEPVIDAAFDFESKSGQWTHGGPGPSISDRLIVFLHALNMEAGEADALFYRGAEAVAQRGLNELLLEYPVLMLPQVMVITRLPNGKSTLPFPLAHAICVTRRGRLPRLSDWPAGTAPREAFAAFADHHVVRCGLEVRSPDSSSGSPARSRSALNTAPLYDRDSVALAGELVALRDLGRAGADASPLGSYLDAWGHYCNGTNANPLAGNVANALDAICRDYQRVDLALGAGPAWASADRDFMALVRALSDEDKATTLSWFEIMTGPRIVWRPELSTPPVENTARQTSYNVDSMVKLLVAAGLHADRIAAAQWIHDTMTLVESVSTEPALGFVQGLRAQGIEFTRSTQTLGPGWVQAIEIAAAERGMHAVIEASVGDATPAQAPGRAVRSHRLDV
ncbi:hypothetical protein ABIC83_002724 [Roseateles asaccharophilus]|uniref:hypothetical protein n=1 Tax=Roseateles asaccharophilus TaxID=582607 RepID=UPI003835E0FE